MAEAGADVVGVDWRTPLDRARARLGPDVAVQGNLDPAVCLAPWPVVAEHAHAVLAAAGPARATSSTWATACCPRPIPTSWPAWSTSSTPRRPA